MTSSMTPVYALFVLEPRYMLASSILIKLIMGCNKVANETEPK